MNPTDFFTPYCKSRLERWSQAHLASFRVGLGLCLLALALAWAPGLVRAEARLESIGIHSTEQVILLSAQMDFELPVPVEDALQRGVPLFFSAEASVYQQRWYWTDRLLVRGQRYWRLSFQPLTRRYRLQSSPQPIESSGLGVGLAQTYDALPEALAALQRISAWSLPTGLLEESGKHRLEFRFRLEPNALLRPWLSGSKEGEWGLSLQHTQAFKVGARP